MIHLKAFDQLLNRKPDSPTLFHYTTPGGLIGIVESKSIWATHIRFLNDSMEFRHALKLASEVIENLTTAEENIDRHEGLRRMREGIAGAGINICVASFTERGDDLGQWRGYGKSGYALGIPFASLAERAAATQWLFGPCVYAREAQAELMKQLLLEVLELHLQEPKDGEEEDLRRLHSGYPIALYLNSYAPFFKDAAFAEEREWRLVSRPLSYRHMRMRAGASMLVPYYTYALVGTDTDAIPVESVRVGPTPDPILAWQGVEALLLGKGLRECVIENSIIPYRDW
ncbi:DUF2971 domain-containing protein [Ralstonia pseudosolanacearum]|uniref:DUF2971 domain-containing protein n=1 Tax=Ralstonia pseudosolanacearum TaxID=1310165 RepID=UPI00048ADB60|nr:DUF2971 domain-containing protein [Ralstonia pseudosolanacearum]